MSESPEIHDEASYFAQFLHGINEGTFVIGLPEVHGIPRRGGLPLAARLHVRQRLRAIDVGLTDAEQVEVGPVQDGDGLAHSVSMPGTPRRSSR